MLVATVLLAGPSRGLARDAESDRPLAASFSGDTGVARVDSARTGAPGTWAVGGHGLYFQQRGFVDTTTGAKDYDEFASAIGSISWTPWQWLEMFGSSTTRENYNSKQTPNEDASIGALSAGAKISTSFGRGNGPIWIALTTGLQIPANVDKIQFRTDTLGGFGTGIFTTDLTERQVPFRLHANAGYVIDRSGALILTGQSAARTFALGLSNRNRFTWGFALEAPFAHMTPFLEFSGTKPDEIRFPDSPGFVTPGIRLMPTAGLSLDAALDFGLTRSIVNGGTSGPGPRPVSGPPIVPATPRRQFVVGLSYSFASNRSRERRFEERNEAPDAARKRIAELESELAAANAAAARPAKGSNPPRRGGGRDTVAFRGLVLDATTLAPLGDAVVSFPDTSYSRLLADPSSGFFRSYPFAPGSVNVSVAKPGYETLQQSVSVQQGSDEVVKFLLKRDGGESASTSVGTFKGRILDERNVPTAGTLVFVDGPLQSKEIASAGTFSTKVPPGLHRVEVKAAGYLLQGRRITVPPGEMVTWTFVLRPVPKERRVEAVGSKITTTEAIAFSSTGEGVDRSSFSLLDEVADLILSHPEYAAIRVEGHTDDRGSAEYNLTLSDRRARSVVAYLVNKGVPAERLQALGWGKAKPIADGTDDAARAQNRRIEFNIQQP